MKNILFLLHCPPPVHGSAIVGQNIMKSPLINKSFDCRYVNLLLSRKIDETGKPTTLKALRYVALWFRVLFEILNERPDACYMALTVSGKAFYKDVLLVALLRFFLVPRVYHLHNQGVVAHSSSKIYDRLYRFVFHDAEVILLSKYLYADVKAYVPIERVHVCHNGISDTCPSVSQPVDDENKCVAPPRLLFFSNMMVAKGVMVLLDACSVLSERGVAFECVFVGGEADVNATLFSKFIRERHLGENVRYIGAGSADEKPMIFNSADIFVLPTLNDCFPLVLLEAMQYAMPVVASEEGGIPDIVEDGHTGFIVEKNNVSLLVEKLELLINHPDRRKEMGNAGRERFEQDFRLEHFEFRLNNILQGITCV